MKKINLIIILAIVVSMCFALTGSAAPGPKIVDLGTLGGCCSYARIPMGQQQQTNIAALCGHVEST